MWIFCSNRRCNHLNFTTPLPPKGPRKGPERAPKGVDGLEIWCSDVSLVEDCSEGLDAFRVEPMFPTNNFDTLPPDGVDALSQDSLMDNLNACKPQIRESIPSREKYVEHI